MFTAFLAVCIQQSISATYTCELRRLIAVSSYCPEAFIQMISALGNVTPERVQSSCMLDLFLDPEDHNGPGRALKVRAVMKWFLDDPVRFNTYVHTIARVDIVDWVSGQLHR
jgi:hypothetical protein